MIVAEEDVAVGVAFVLRFVGENVRPRRPFSVEELAVRYAMDAGVMGLAVVALYVRRDRDAVVERG